MYSWNWKFNINWCVWHKWEDCSPFTEHMGQIWELLTERILKIILSSRQKHLECVWNEIQHLQKFSISIVLRYIFVVKWHLLHINVSRVLTASVSPVDLNKLSYFVFTWTFGRAVRLYKYITCYFIFGSGVGGSGIYKVGVGIETLARKIRWEAVLNN